MKTILAIVWLLSNGQLQGEPFQYYDSYATCEDGLRAAQAKLRGDRILLLAGCVDAKANNNYTGIELHLTPGLAQ